MSSLKELNQRVITEAYDLSGNGILRVMRLAGFARVVPVGNFFTGPGLRCLLVLFLLHTFGSPLYQLYARHGEKLGPLKRQFKR